MNLLEVQNLSISVKNSGNLLVRNISFGLSMGKITGLVGESGSGKSQTALSILRLTAASLQISGQIWWHGAGSEPVDVNRFDKLQLQSFRGGDVGMIFQDPGAALNPSKRVGWQVREAVLLHRKTSKPEAKSLVLNMFEKVQLPNPERIYNAYSFQLSGGQRQRVMIAMAMVNNPKLLIADEATTALDVTVQSEIIQLIKDLQKQENLTVLFITHDLALLNGFADNVVVMRNGIIEEQGGYSDVYQHPKSLYTKGLIACRPTAHSKGFRLAVVEDFYTNPHFSAPQRDATVPSELKLIDVSNLEVIYNQGKKNQFKALKEVSFELMQGETLGIVGESGCGKTTLSKTLLQLINYKGIIVLNGKPITLKNRAEHLAFRKQVQFVFQDPYSSLNPSIRIGDLIAEVLKVHGLGNSSAHRNHLAVDLLQQVGLPLEFFNRYPHELSGGQRQRVAIARALAPKPELLILDEAVAALDVSVQAKVLNLLNDLKMAFGLTYIFISHNLEVVHYMSDRILVMNRGEIVEINTADALYHHPQHPYTQKLISATPI